MHGLNHWKIKKSRTVFLGVIDIVNKTKRKRNKLWFDLGKQFFNSPMQKWLNSHDILMHSTHNEAKSIVTERFIRSLKDKI